MWLKVLSAPFFKVLFPKHTLHENAHILQRCKTNKCQNQVWHEYFCFGNPQQQIKHVRYAVSHTSGLTTLCLNYTILFCFVFVYKIRLWLICKWEIMVISRGWRVEHWYKWSVTVCGEKRQQNVKRWVFMRFGNWAE